MFRTGVLPHPESLSEDDREERCNELTREGKPTFVVVTAEILRLSECTTTSFPNHANSIAQTSLTMEIFSFYSQRISWDRFHLKCGKIVL